MRLFEAIIDANHRAVAGDKNAGVYVTEFENELPVVALTCVDPRLNALFPSALGLPGDQFIWLRNAGNIITGPMSSTMRSLALACAVKGGKEIAIIGHTDCQVAKTSMMQLLERLKAAGVERHLLPENLTEYFGLFASEPQNVMKACEYVRQSPLVGPKVPVHGLIISVETGKLDWIVNGYEAQPGLTSQWSDVVKSAGQTFDALKSLAEFKIGGAAMADAKIGEAVGKAEDWLAKKVESLIKHPPAASEPAPPTATPPKVPAPPVIRPRMHMRHKP